MAIPEAAQDHYRTMQALQALAIKAGQQAWARVDPANVAASWIPALASLLPVVELAQRRAAFEGATYSAMTLAQQSTYTPPDAFVDVDAFAGFASDGRPLDSLLARPALGAQALIDGGMASDLALESGLGSLGRMLTTQVADAGRQAGGIDVASRTGVGYVRMVRPGACPRCSIQAGRWFRWNAGFLRHPRCSCVHVASRAGSLQGALDEGLVKDPYEAFKSLPAAEQDRIYGASNAQAIRDGADISQVVNSRRGMTKTGVFTYEGTTGAGNAAKGLKPRQRRMTPEGIYEQGDRLGKDRQWTLDRLEEHGYILPGGQNPTGSLRGQREGWGQPGSGGGIGRSASDRARVNARKAIEEARRTGVRDPNVRYTMTAAERRVQDAKNKYENALSGRSPYRSEPAFGNKPDPSGRWLYVGSGRGSNSQFVPVTQKELAEAEYAYRMWLARRGEIFTE